MGANAHLSIEGDDVVGAAPASNKASLTWMAKGISLLREGANDGRSKQASGGVANGEGACVLWGDKVLAFDFGEEDEPGKVEVIR